MATIKITRTSEYINRFRAYGIYIDGKKVGTIANGQTKEFEVSAGKHTLYTKIDWCTSSEISFSAFADEVHMYKVGGFKNSNWIMLVVFAVVALNLILEMTLGFGFSIYLLVIMLLFFVYYLTSGRKKYLTIKEVS